MSRRLLITVAWAAALVAIDATANLKFIYLDELDAVNPLSRPATGAEKAAALPVATSTTPEPRRASQALPFDIAQLRPDVNAPQRPFSFVSEELSCLCTMAPTQVPTPGPTWAPTVDPTAEPTYEPTAEPTYEPTAAPTADPSATPTAVPTVSPTAEPTGFSSASPTADPTADPSATPTASPSAVPTASPTASPTAVPSVSPSAIPSAAPSVAVTAPPSCPTCSGLTVVIRFCISLQLNSCDPTGADQALLAALLQLLLSMLSGGLIAPDSISLTSILPLLGLRHHQLQQLQLAQPSAATQLRSSQSALHDQFFALAPTSTATATTPGALMRFNITVQGPAERLADPYGVVDSATLSWVTAMQSGEFAAKLAELAQENGVLELEDAQPAALSVSNVDVSTVAGGGDGYATSSTASPLSTSAIAGVVLGGTVGFLLLLAAAYVAYVRYVRKGISAGGAEGGTVALAAVHYREEAVAGVNALHPANAAAV
eukprot:gene9876-7074_t